MNIWAEYSISDQNEMRTVYLRRDPLAGVTDHEQNAVQMLISTLPIAQQLDRIRELELVLPSKSLLRQISKLDFSVEFLLENQVYLPILAILEQGKRISSDEALKIVRHCATSFTSPIQLRILQKLIPSTHQLNHAIAQFSLHPLLETCPEEALYFLIVLADNSLLADNEFEYCLDFAFRHIFSWQREALLLLSIMLSDGRFFEQIAQNISLIFDQLASVDHTVVSEAIACIQMFVANFGSDYHEEVEEVINRNGLIGALRNVLPMCSGNLYLAVNVLETAVEAANTCEAQLEELVECSEYFYYAIGDVPGIEDEDVWANFLDMYGNAQT